MMIWMNENESGVFAVWGQDRGWKIHKLYGRTRLLPNLVFCNVNDANWSGWLSVGKWSTVEFVSGRVNLDHSQPVIQNWSKTGVCGFQSSSLYSVFLKVMFGLVLLHHFLPRQESTWQQSVLSDNYIHDISSRNNNDVWQQLCWLFRRARNKHYASTQ